MDQDTTTERRIRFAALVVLLGLAVCGGTLFWEHPITFFAFLLVGGLLTVAGIVGYLFALLARG